MIVNSSSWRHLWHSSRYGWMKNSDRFCIFDTSALEKWLHSNPLTAASRTVRTVQLRYFFLFPPHHLSKQFTRKPDYLAFLSRGNSTKTCGLWNVCSVIGWQQVDSVGRWEAAQGVLLSPDELVPTLPSCSTTAKALKPSGRPLWQGPLGTVC